MVSESLTFLGESSELLCSHAPNMLKLMEGGGNAAQLVECSPSVPKTLGAIPSTPQIRQGDERVPVSSAFRK